MPDPLGGFSLVLHGHLPYVARHGGAPHGTAWLYEAIAETYLPLLDLIGEIALNAVRPGGTVSVVGVHDMNPFPLNALGCLIRSVTLRMTTAPVQRTWPELIPLLQSGRLDVDGIFTTTMPLDEAAKAYATAESRSGADVKIMLTP